MKNSTKRNLKNIGAALLCAAICILNTFSASAGTHTWTGAAGNGLWSTAGNWQGNSKPLFGETDVRIVFPANGTASSTVDIPNLVVNEFLVTRGIGNNIVLGGTAGMKLTLEARPGFTNVHLFSGNITFQASLELVVSNDCRMLVHGREECQLVGQPPTEYCGHVNPGEITISSKVSGPGGLFFDGWGAASVLGSTGNTYEGLTRIAPKITLRLNKSSGNAVPANLWIESLAVPGSDALLDPSQLWRGTVMLLDDHQISNTGSITNYGLIEATNRTDIIGPLTMVHGRINGPGSYFTLNGSVTAHWESLPSDLSYAQASRIYASTVSLGTAPGGRPVRSFNVTTNASLVISASIVGANTIDVNKNGSGKLTFSGINTFDGDAVVYEGTLDVLMTEWGLGTTNGVTRVYTGGELSVSTDVLFEGTLVFREHLFLHGGTFSASTRGVIDCPTPIVLQTNSTITGSTFQMSGPISGPGGLRIFESGSSVFIFGSVGLRFTGTNVNTYAGLTIVEDSNIDLARASGATAIPTSLIVTGDVSLTTVNVLAPNQIADSASVYIGHTCELYLSNAVETITSLDLSSGRVDGPGTLGIISNVTVLASPFNGPNIISAPLHLKGGGSHTIQVGDAPDLYPDLKILSGISSDVNIGFTKKGTGVLELSGTNTFTGVVVVSEGPILAESPYAFGASGGGAGLYLYQGGTVNLGDDLSFLNEPLTIAGGTLTMGTGAHLWSGTVALQTNGIVNVSNAFASLNFSGVVSGPANFRKTGPGQMHLTGNGANTFTGILFIDDGEVRLSKTNVLAVPSHVIIGTPTNPATLRLFRNAQIATGGYVVAEHPGSIFDVQSFNQTIGSFTGNGVINIGAGLLAVGGDGNGSGFAGGSINGSGTLQKLGTGTFTVAGNNGGFTGGTIISGGTLVVNGPMANSPMVLANNSKLAGSGSVGFVSGNGMVSPGNSPGKLTTKHFTNSASSVLMIELNGTTPGTTHDQIDVTGTLKLGGTLQVTRGSNTAPNSQFTIIKNDSSDAVNGIFSGLAQGAQFTVGGAKFQISYTGGDGNDVVLTQVGTATNAVMRGVSKIIGSTMQISGVGSPGFDYTVQGNTNLNTTNWITLGTATAFGDGVINFNDFNALANHPMRFYRFVIP